MNQELKEAIITWLFNSPNEWQRVNACHDRFKRYIYDDAGNYLICGEEVSRFIEDADRLIYRGETL